MNQVRTVLLFAFLMMSVTRSNPLFAQKIRIGFRAIPTINGLLNSQDVGNIQATPTAGVGAGVSIAYQISAHWGFEANVLFSLTGQNYDGRSLFNDYFINFRVNQLLENYGRNVPSSYQVSLTYLKFPLMATYTSTNTKGPIFKAMLGPQIGYLISASDKAEGRGISYTGTTLTSATDRYNSIDVALVIGAGADFRINKKLYLNTGLRLEFGLLDIERKGVFWTPPSPPGQSGSQVIPPESYYGNYYGVGNARSSATRTFSVGFVLGISYVLSNQRDPKDYKW